MMVIELEEVYRQGNDCKFKKFLSELRMGKVSPVSEQFLISLSRPIKALEEQTHLFFANDEINFYILSKLSALEGQQETFESVDRGSVAGLRTLAKKF